MRREKLRKRLHVLGVVCIAPCAEDVLDPLTVGYSVANLVKVTL